MLEGMFEDKKDTDLNTYWFVIVKEIEDDEGWVNDISREVFKLHLGSREQAKQYVINKYGKLPFRKPKQHKVKDKYFYLTTSNLYWYDMHNKKHKLVCDYCNQEYIQIGNTRASKMFNINGKNICSVECYLNYKRELEIKYNSMGNKKYWVGQNEHPLTDPNKALAGYIYKITNKISMKSYVGKTIKPPIFRWWQHLAVDEKFEQQDLSELVFEVLEIVYYNENDEWDKFNYGNAENKLSEIERLYIDHFDTVNNGFNKI